MNETIIKLESYLTLSVYHHHKQTAYIITIQIPLPLGYPKNHYLLMGVSLRVGPVSLLALFTQPLAHCWQQCFLSLSLNNN